MSTIVITGASQGIGRAIALRFAGDEDVRLALVARNLVKLNDVAADCRKLGATVEVYSCDITDNPAVEAVAAQVLAS